MTPSGCRPRGLARGTYRIIYRINEDKHTVEIHSLRHRRDIYRT